MTLQKVISVLLLAHSANGATSFTSASEAKEEMNSFVSKVVAKLETSYVDIASEEGGSCDSKPTASACDLNTVGPWTTASYDEQYTNPLTKSCTRFDKNQRNEFLSTIVTGKRSTCSPYSCPTSADCTEKYGNPNSASCKCNYNIITGSSADYFAKHVDTKSKVDFLYEGGCTTQKNQTQQGSSKECAVNKDYFGYNLPAGDLSQRAKGEICSTNNLVPLFKEEAAVHKDISWNFMGMQETGLYRNYPAIYQCRTEAQCSGCSDPRFRSWYAEAASGPKDVILVLDTSGSMQDHGRITKMREAASWVVNTLSTHDHAAVVSYSSVAKAYPTDGLMTKMDVVGRAKVKDHISDLAASGATNMEAGITRAFQIMAASGRAGRTSKCSKVMLFLTDGERSNGRNPVDVAHEMNAGGDAQMRIFTYSFGGGADVKEMKALACQNQGVWQAVPDDGDLKQIMAGYFLYLSAGLDANSNGGIGGTDAATTHKNIRWADWFEDGQGLGQLAGACSPVFDRTRSAKTGVAILFGVVCSAISRAAWDAYGDGPAVWAGLGAASRRCPSVFLTEEKLEIIRARVSAASVCAASSSGDHDDTRNLIVGVVATAAVVALALFCVCKSKAKKTGGESNGRSSGSSGKSSTATTTTTANARLQPVQYNNNVAALGQPQVAVPMGQPSIVPMAQVVAVVPQPQPHQQV